MRQAITAAFENAAHSGSEREGASNEMNDEDDVLLSKLIGDASVSEVSNISLDNSASKEVDEVTADQLDSVEAQLASLHGCKEDGEFDSDCSGTPRRAVIKLILLQSLLTFQVAPFLLPVKWKRNLL